MLAALYRKGQFLSLDIVIGAVVLLRFFSTQFSSSISWEVYALLACSVWLIYTIDHLRDAKKAKDSIRERYQFHLRNEGLLKSGMLLVLAFCLYCVFHISSIILLAGSFLVLLSVIYLGIQHQLSKWGLKEVYVSIIYSSGILLAPFVTSESTSIVAYLLLFLLTSANLILFSWFEREDDLTDGFSSIATVVGDIHLQRIILLVIAMGFSMSFLVPVSLISSYFMIAFLAYGILFVGGAWFRKNGWYRLIGDGIFLLPVVVEWW